MANLNTPLACSLCGVESSFGEIGTHLVEVHIGPGGSDWLCADACHYRTSSEADMASHCLITNHPASSITRPLIFPELLSAVQTACITAVTQKEMFTQASDDSIPASPEAYGTRNASDTQYLQSKENNTSERQSELPTSPIQTGLVNSDENKCDECDYSSTRQALLAQHLHTHYPAAKSSFKCLHCQYSNARRWILIRHMRTHTGERPFQCPHCPYSCARRCSLKSHLRTHTRDPDTHSPRRSHVRIHIGKKPPFQCSYCPYTSCTRRMLAYHIRLHVGRIERPFKCPHCPFSSPKSPGLEQHLRTHSGERPYQCKQCPYAASRLYTLVEHIRTHTGKRPIKCPHCPYSCALKGRFTIHLRTHTGERPYQCPMCSARFIQMSSLKREERTFTSDVKSLKQTCRRLYTTCSRLVGDCIPAFSTVSAVLRAALGRSGLTWWRSTSAPGALIGSAPTPATTGFHSTLIVPHCKTLVFESSSEADMASHCLIANHPASSITRPRIFPELLSAVQMAIISSSVTRKEMFTPSSNNALPASPEPPMTDLGSPNREDDADLPEPKECPNDVTRGKIMISFDSPDKLKFDQKYCTGNISDTQYAGSEEDEPSESESGSSATSVRTVSNNRGKEKCYCDICEYSSTRRDHLMRHLLTHASSVRRDNWASHPRTLTRHQPSLKRFCCDFCNYSSARRDHLPRHMQTHLKTRCTRDYERTVCEASFTKLSGLENRNPGYATGKGERRHACTHLHCTYAARNRKNLARHIRIHTGERPYKCPHCPYSCTQRQKLNSHIRTHTGERPYQCPQCPYAAKQSCTLVDHIRRHTGERPYKCSHCPYSCAVKGNMKFHLRTHTGEKPYVCPICTFRFTMKGSLKLHHRVHHPDSKYVFENRQELRRQSRTQIGKQDFNCDICPFFSVHKDHLTCHQRMHTRNPAPRDKTVSATHEREIYYCDLCDYSTAWRKHLIQHQQTHEPSSNVAFKCPHCPYCRRRKSELQRHLRTHTGERPYQCPTCLRRFTQTTHLNVFLSLFPQH